MTTDLMIAAADALREAAGARAKFPGNRLNHLATMEEVGEHAQALLEHSRGKATAEQVYAEAIQCAAMYLRLATEGTGETPYKFSMSLSKAFTPTTPKTPAVKIVEDPTLPPDMVVAAPALPIRPPISIGWPTLPPGGIAVPYHAPAPTTSDRAGREDGFARDSNAH